MHATQEQRLLRIKNYATAYEVILTNGTQRYLVVYCRKTIAGIFDSLRAKACKRHLRIGEIVAPNGFHVQAGAIDTTEANLPAWTVKFSGQTQRECILGGELPFIFD